MAKILSLISMLVFSQTLSAETIGFIRQTYYPAHGKEAAEETSSQIKSIRDLVGAQISIDASLTDGKLASTRKKRLTSSNLVRSFMQNSIGPLREKLMYEKPLGMDPSVYKQERMDQETNQVDQVLNTTLADSLLKNLQTYHDTLNASSSQEKSQISECSTPSSKRVDDLIEKSIPQDIRTLLGRIHSSEVTDGFVTHVRFTNCLTITLPILISVFTKQDQYFLIVQDYISRLLENELSILVEGKPLNERLASKGQSLPANVNKDKWIQVVKNSLALTKENQLGAKYINSLLLKLSDGQRKVLIDLMLQLAGKDIASGIDIEQLQSLLDNKDLQQSSFFQIHYSYYHALANSLQNLEDYMQEQKNNAEKVKEIIDPIRRGSRP